MRFPDDSVVLHIGPHKTGTTTLQGAMHEAREGLAAQGVHYAGPKAHSMTAAMAAATGKHLSTQGPESGERKWSNLVDEVRASTARQIVVSSEFYSDAPAERISHILEALGAERVQVVVTLRPLVRIVASQWQQYMQNRPGVQYDDDLGYVGWLRAILDHPESRQITPTFWRRHDHARLIERWASVVGPERITVVVVDDSDRQGLLRSFEHLLGLTEGTLVPRKSGTNRSLTMPEITFLTAFNRRYVGSDHSLADYTKFVRFGAVRFLLGRTPAPDEARLLTPAWAVERVSELGRASAAAIAETGVRVVGDLSLLGDPSVASNVGENQPSDDVPVEVVAQFLAGLFKVASRLRSAELPDDFSPSGTETRLREALRRGDGDVAAAIARTRQELARTGPVDDLSRAQATRILAGRLRRRLGRWARRDRDARQ
ncbi:hypothetical protein ncot_17515 [Nocardioides sp. JQ2195]|uniref:hypothetical protein n=1 Tax=Nocardioides sp. JQ2195 TaxID=2592334 RepID=UPI00143E8A7E|nr:hypothetical protein [Nocardioides sp. JQ2195]QIX28187.1 hypothetical protein ncot_17515 [Nocardioides sp. JQ2195]